MDNLTPITREEMLLNDEPLTPITREEKILAGEDLTPVTRREYFLKKYRHAGGDVMVEGLSVTANGTYTAPEGKAYSPVEVAVPLPENAYLLKEASGSLVSFSDGADLPMPSFICNIDAVQDLHGYDGPWIGGAGKNLFYINPQTLGGITVSLNSDGSYMLNGSAPNAVFLRSNSYNLKVGQYRLSASSSSSSGYFVRIRNADTLVLISTMSADDGEGVNVSISADTNVFWEITVLENTTFSNVKVYPQLELGTVKTTFVPYSNICPISGHTGVDAVISPTTEASAGTTYSVSWQTEAGEVYGGYVDLVSGELTVDRVGITYSDTDKKRDDGSFRLYPAPSNALVTNTDNEQPSPLFICDKYKFMSIAEVITTSAVNVGIGISKTSSGFYIKDTTMLQMTLEEAKTYLSSHPIDVVYPLAEAQTYQLTPTQIKSLLGNNNAWCSTGDIDIEYLAKEV